MTFSFSRKRKRIEVAHVLVEIHLDRLARRLHADLEVGENDGIGERLQFAEPPAQRRFRPIAADRGRAAQDLGAVALGHADRANRLRPASAFRYGPAPPRPRRPGCGNAPTGIRSRTSARPQIRSHSGANWLKWVGPSMVPPRKPSFCAVASSWIEAWES